MTGLAPSRAVRWVIALVVGAGFALPLVATFWYTLSDGESTSAVRWLALLDPSRSALYRPVWTGLANSLLLAVLTVALVLALLAPTMILVTLRFGRLRRLFEFVVLLPISIPAIVLVVGLGPIYRTIGRSLGTGTWTLFLAYGITVLPFAFRSIQASLDAVDVRTLAEAARSLGASWPQVVLRVLVPNLRSGLLAAALIATAVVLGEFTIASLLNRQVLQTSLLVVSNTDAYAASIFTLLSLGLAFGLLVVIGRLGRAGNLWRSS